MGRDKDAVFLPYRIVPVQHSLSLALPAGTVSASNETTSGTITGTETWAGVHTLTGDVTIAPGAKLIINPGATIEFPNGTHLDVRGSLCAGVASCGASSNAGPAMRQPKVERTG